uniref:Major facilitator superfamily (MFS) profile domain-containing protein n=1 Tax=Psilocybe cubensis TaxID=181762 RepID=A0A8H8CHZ4_PSICU
MSTEETPLLSVLAGNPSCQTSTIDVYSRFSTRRKKVVIGLVSWCGLIPFFVNGTFTPSVPQIASDLNTTGSVVNYAISVSWIAASLGGLIGGAYSTFYGRRIIYNYSLPLVALGSMGVAISQNIPMLLCWRFLQALGASPSQVLGAGVIGDIYKLEERGGAMAIFFATILVGPSLAPVAGGWVAFYYSWRIMQASLGVLAILSYFVMFVFFPETSHPGSRGIDKARSQCFNQSGRDIGFVFLNPLRLMLLLRSPILLSISVILSASVMTVFVMLVPLVYTVGERYNISSEALVGLCFLPTGLGNMAGAIVVGRISDYTVVQWRRKRAGVWYPEDRLRVAIVPAATLVPISLIAFGLTVRFIDGTLGLTICLFCLFLNGLGAEMTFGPCAAYLVDIMQSRSAEALAANSGLRSFIVAGGIAIVLPMINCFGIVVTNSVFALVAWLTLILLCVVINYGDRLRAWVDVGFVSVDDN